MQQPYGSLAASQDDNYRYDAWAGGGGGNDTQSQAGSSQPGYASQVISNLYIEATYT